MHPSFTKFVKFQTCIKLDHESGNFFKKSRQGLETTAKTSHKLIVVYVTAFINNLRFYCLVPFLTCTILLPCWTSFLIDIYATESCESLRIWISYILGNLDCRSFTWMDNFCIQPNFFINLEIENFDQYPPADKREEP